jgi:plasmid stabilization system protein ParE
MLFRVELTDRARRDLSSLYARINAAKSSAAARWFNGLEESVYGLERLPHRCPIAPEAKKAKRSLRHLLYGNSPHIYRAIYEIDQANEKVYVLTIRHGAVDCIKGSAQARLDELS